MLFDAQTEGEILDHVLLQQAVDQLSDRHRAVIGLVMGKYTRREIALLLGIPRTTATNIYREALNILQQAMFAQ